MRAVPQFGFAAPAAAVIAGHKANECWTSTAADVDAWLAIARPGETFVYAFGPQLVQGGAAGRVAALTTSGDVTPHHKRRPDGGFDFIIRRTCPQPRTPLNRAPVCTPDMLTVLVAIQDDAQANRRCRSDSQIGAATGMTADQVKWQLRKLEDAKFITRQVVACGADAKYRIVTVTATGQTTAGPQA